MKIGITSNSTDISLSSSPVFTYLFPVKTCNTILSSVQKKVMNSDIQSAVFSAPRPLFYTITLLKHQISWWLVLFTWANKKQRVALQKNTGAFLGKMRRCVYGIPLLNTKSQVQFPATVATFWWAQTERHPVLGFKCTVHKCTFGKIIPEPFTAVSHMHCFCIASRRNDHFCWPSFTAVTDIKFVYLPIQLLTNFH